MTYAQLIRHYKTPEAARAALGVTRQCLHYWKGRGIPWGRQARIELMTGGKLKAAK